MSVKEAGVKCNELEAKVKGKLFVGGTKPSAEDVKLFNDFLGADNVNLFRWVKHIGSFPEAERKGWGAPAKVAVATGTTAALEGLMASKPANVPAAAAKEAAPKVEAAPKAAAPAPKAAAPAPKAAAPAPADDDDDDVDLFGEETEEEKAALEAKKAKDAAAKKAKPAVIAKSSILIDIKPWEDTVDLEALAKKMRAVERDGLLWGDYKLVPVAFGVKKLQQLIVVEDDKVSGDDLEDLIMSFEDEVQSMDIAAWNKI